MAVLIFKFLYSILLTAVIIAVTLLGIYWMLLLTTFFAQLSGLTQLAYWTKSMADDLVYRTKQSIKFIFRRPN